MRSNKNLAKIVELLNDGKFHNGTVIGQKLNISRTAVWKVIKKLKSYKITIKSLKNKGYCLDHPLILLEKEKIINPLKGSILIELFEKVTSTNDYLKTLSNNRYVVCIAEMQTKGKGRFNRTWHSPFAQNIYLSLKYSFNKDVSDLAGLSLVCGLSVCRAIETTCNLPKPIFIKWPNDIICDNKKLAGILIEIQAETNGFSSVIIGIGVNVNMKNSEQKINQTWTSLINLTECYYDRNELCTSLIYCLIYYLKIFKKRGLIFFQDSWKQKDYLFNKALNIKSGQKKFQGIGCGINHKGNLIVKLTNGLKKEFSSGDTTLIKNNYIL